LETLQEEIKGSLAGNAMAQRMLYRRLAGKMLLVCMRYMKNKTEAEDVLQEGFMLVFQKLDQYNGSGSFEGWIRKIMVNKSLEHLRKSVYLYPMKDLSGINDYAISTEDVFGNIASKDLLRMIQELPPAYRTIFNLYVFEGLKHKEIAEMLGISEGTSKSNLSDARKLLKKRIQPVTKQSLVVNG